ncbi:single-stranded-DNA-specific exonuclease RecJ [Desulfitobacterium metallireducens]|uniref:single-stranded-DNA-specific exonuclease RecJ n=1 Tax=Desulfitobacterium metallireducens TaxID=142877 RepID=UPI0012EB912A
MLNKIWIKPQPVGPVSDRIQSQLELSPIVADILARRGLSTKKQVVDFLRPSLLNLNSPWAFHDMAQAIERLALAHSHHEKVLIYGDYDVDGVTSSALLYKVLIDLNFQAVAYIPSRKDEGYGLNKEAILKASQSNVILIITVDCGITAVEEIAYAKELGIDVILTDHHEPPEILPEAFAILNPKVTESGYPFRELAGVGVAFKLAQALLEYFRNLGTNQRESLSEIEILDLVALGTIADLVPLVDENRVIVSYGLKQMEHTVHVGMQALLEECGLENKPLKAGQIAFMVAPRINAAGRMDSAKAGLELLLTGRPERAQELARYLSQENTDRQETEKEILAEAVAQLEQHPLPRVIVLSAPNWHPGVIGIVASRLVERFYRPVFLMTEEGEEAKGSARGIPGYHVLNALRGQADLFERFGGHSQAAGFSLKCSNIAALREGLNQNAAEYPEDLFCEHVKVDQLVSLASIDGSLLSQLEQLAPFGLGNPSPVLAGVQLPLHRVNTVGKDKAHLKCQFGLNGEIEGIAFRKGDAVESLRASKCVDVTFGLDWNTYRGPDAVQMMLKDVEPEAFWEERENLQEHQEAVGEFLQGRTEVAATYGESAKGYDWRNYGREQWLHALQEEIGITPEDWTNVLVWDGLHDQTRWTTLTEFLKGHTNLRDQVIDQEKPWLMILFLGLPTSWEEWTMIRAQMAVHLLTPWATAEAQLSDSDLQRRAGYLTREELIEVYRILAQLAKQAKPSPFFSWTPKAQDGGDPLEALKIFEELGLIRILGGTERFALEWIPTQKKLDLDSSLRYHSGKRTWEDLCHFAKEFSTASWSDLVIKNGY